MTVPKLKQRDETLDDGPLKVFLDLAGCVVMPIDVATHASPAKQIKVVVAG